MNIRNIAIAVAVAAAGFATTQAFAQDRDLTVTHQRPDGTVVTKHVRSDEFNGVHRTVRVDRPDGSTFVRRSTRYGEAGDFGPRMHRTVVVRHRYEPMRHVIVRDVQHRPGYGVNRRVTVIRNGY
jgi:hypothetical protein